MSFRQPMPVSASPSLDAIPRFVRFNRLTERGFVEFAFGIGSRELMVDLVLPLEGYREFCETHQVTYLTREEGEALDFEQAKWRFGAPGIRE